MLPVTGAADRGGRQFGPAPETTGNNDDFCFIRPAKLVGWTEAENMANLEMGEQK